MTNFISLLAAAPEHTNLIARFIDLLNNGANGVGGIGMFGVTVIVFTLIFKFALLPLDLWQKFSMRKQSLAMERLRPQLEKLERQYANKPDILKQKQAELQRGQMTGMLGSCLPMIVTMVVFFVVLSGFNEYIRVENEKIVYTIAEAFKNGATAEEIALLYQPEKFLWIKNIYMPDTWSAVIPTMEQYVGSGMGALNATRPDIANFANWYTELIGPAAAMHNPKGFTDIANWNGYLILPILSIITSILSAKLMGATQAQSAVGTKEQQKSAQKTQKYMNYIMPVMFGVFSLFYSSAFALYIFISSLFSTIFNLTFNLIVKSKDKKRANIVG